MDGTDLSLQAAMVPLVNGGLNRWGVVTAAAYDAVAKPGLRCADLAPWCRSIVVFASGGRRLWDEMMVAMRGDPSLLTDHPHPLDSHVERLTSGVRLGGGRARWILATADESVFIDFRTLAVLAGVGAPSRLGLVIHPDVGPWMGLRAACFVEDVFSPSSPAQDVCASCDAPCISACPAGALADGQWKVGVCATFHRDSEECSQTCHSREACPVGAEHRYSELQRGYHYNRSRGRRALRLAVGVSDGEDHFDGIGPHWGDWSSSDS